jgi:L-amino acid N-acyltransferase YncA
VQPKRASQSPSVTVGAMCEAHWPEVRAIYQAGIDTGHATFADSPPATWAAWQLDHLNDLSVVALDDCTVMGWASLARVSGRCVYAGVAEVSVYVATQSQGRGVGRQLLVALIEQSEAKNFWTLQAGIFPENAASTALHRALGFELVGLRRRLGKMSFGLFKDQWRDVLLFERRSNRVGIC